MSETTVAPYSLPPLPPGRAMHLVDRHRSSASPRAVFDIVKEVGSWPRHLSHYRYVNFRAIASDGGGLVEMAANRPFGFLNWPTWWLSEMAVDHSHPLIRFRHVGGITTGMDVEWRFDESAGGGTDITLVHSWKGPAWPLISTFAAVHVIGPIFVHAIATRTMAGLAAAAESSLPGQQR